MHLRAQGLSKGDEHPTNTPHGVWYCTLVNVLSPRSQLVGEERMWLVSDLPSLTSVPRVAFSALILSVWPQEEHLACN